MKWNHSKWQVHIVAYGSDKNMKARVDINYIPYTCNTQKRRAHIYRCQLIPSTHYTKYVQTHIDINHFMHNTCHPVLLLSSVDMSNIIVPDSDESRDLTGKES